MRAWQFGKPKTPGFGISKSFYLSVLASRAVLPAVRDLANPKADNGALPGFAVPLRDESDKTLLERPMERGYYAIATVDRKTVLRLTVVSKEEAGFDPEAFAMSSYAVGASQELTARIRGTWTLCQLTFESHDAMVYAALDFLLAVARRLGELSEGVIGDAICQRYLLPEQVFSLRRSSTQLKVFAEEHVVIKARARADGLQVYTLGLQKFAMPEIEILNLLEDDIESATVCLLWLSQQILEGVKVQEEYQVGSQSMPFDVRMGGLDRGQWEGVPVWELLPPTTVPSSEAIRAWHAEILAGRFSGSPQ